LHLRSAAGYDERLSRLMQGPGRRLCARGDTGLSDHAPYPRHDVGKLDARSLGRRQFLRRSGAIGGAVVVVGVGAAILGQGLLPRHYERGVSLAGAEFGERRLPGIHGIDYFYPTAGSLDYYRAKGLTLLRVPCRWERLQQTLNAPLDSAELSRLDAVVAAADARDMRVIIDIHNFARYQGQLIGTVAVPVAAFADLWRRLAEHYRAVSAVWAFGLMNEPHDTGGRWASIAQAGVDGVDSADPARTVLVSGDGWSSAVDWRRNNESLRINARRGQVLYEAHAYFDGDGSGRYAAAYDAQRAYPDIGVDRARPFAAWLKAHRLHGFMGEYGVPADDERWLVVLDRFLNYLDSEGIGGAYWAGGEHWGAYPLSIAPQGPGDRPQIAVLARHLSRR
jgi:endoglucanase